MNKHFVDIATSIVEHGLVRKGRAQPSRVWHVDPETGKRTLLVDNSDSIAEKKSQAQFEQVIAKDLQRQKPLGS
ncbi:MAG: hypothetical protein MUF71_05710 [Candidatus Kapabacteria bacterium]|jgi:hypothetical protein|nr:hypothetical protein [Candidatus Kapabacteria bacterium]